MTRKPIGRLWRPATQPLIGQKHLEGALLYGITCRPWSRVSQQLVDVDAEFEAAASGAGGSGLEGMRRGIELLHEQNVLWFDGLLKMALAEAEAQWGDAGRAVAIFDETLATRDRTGCCPRFRMGFELPYVVFSPRTANGSLLFRPAFHSSSFEGSRLLSS